jgi:hypothetical protein
MVCREIRGTGRGTSRRGPSGHSNDDPACRPLRSRRFSFDAGMRRVCNASSGEPVEVPDNEVNAHLGNPGLLERVNIPSVECLAAERSPDLAPRPAPRARPEATR